MNILKFIELCFILNSNEQKELDRIESEWEEIKLKLNKLSEGSASIPESKSELKKLLEK